MLTKGKNDTVNTILFCDQNKPQSCEPFLSPKATLKKKNTTFDCSNEKLIGVHSRQTEISLGVLFVLSE